MTYLSEARRRYLEALTDLEWHDAIEVAKNMDKAASGVARQYSELVRAKLAVFQAPSYYAITEAGLNALSERNEL